MQACLRARAPFRWMTQQKTMRVLEYVTPKSGSGTSSRIYSLGNTRAKLVVTTFVYCVRGGRGQDAAWRIDDVLNRPVRRLGDS